MQQKQNLKTNRDKTASDFSASKSFIRKHLGALNNNQIKKVIFVRLGFALALFLSACGQSSAFDASKASFLSEVQRREMDIMLANELETYNQNTERCKVDTNKPGASGACRVAFFKQLASQGYEMADIADKIFDPLRGEIRKDRDAYERLRELADAGDKSALCFAPRIFIWYLQNADWPYTPETEMKYNKQGVAQGLPLCILNDAYSYQHGESGYPKDLNKAHQLALKAASAGLYGGQRFLLYEYGQKHSVSGYQYNADADLKIIRKALCWGRLARMHTSWSLFDSYIGDLVIASRDKYDQSKIIYPELEQLAKDWSLRYTPYDKRPATTAECLKIEEEN